MTTTNLLAFRISSGTAKSKRSNSERFGASSSFSELSSQSYQPHHSAASALGKIMTATLRASYSSSSHLARESGGLVLRGEDYLEKSEQIRA